jgi:hypothetical protein
MTRAVGTIWWVAGPHAEDPGNIDPLEELSSDLSLNVKALKNWIKSEF